jgi:hypothetical protein
MTNQPGCKPQEHHSNDGPLARVRPAPPPPQEDRETLRDQLGAAPAEGDPADFALSAARVRDMEARLLEEREEKAALAAEKAALQVGAVFGGKGWGRWPHAGPGSEEPLAPPSCRLGSSTA